MTPYQANDLMELAPCDGMQSAVNPALTRREAVDVVRKAVEAFERDYPGRPLTALLERRVWQVVKNQIRPRY